MSHLIAQTRGAKTARIRSQPFDRQSGQRRAPARRIAGDGAAVKSRAASFAVLHRFSRRCTGFGLHVHHPVTIARIIIACREPSR
jgi:hypothetical protein